MRLLLLLLALLPAVATAQPCTPRAAVAADGRVLGHLPYGDVPVAELVEVPGFGLRQPCMVRREVAPDLERLRAAAAADTAVGGTIHALSCHRSIARQTGVFCREQPGDAADRAVSVAPPGHSEHTSGYALDFAVRPVLNGCPDVEACMAAHPAARWLRENAPRFGFELSFPPGNAQGVKWEPWHWRWVGARADTPGAQRARFTFAAARSRFPAEPAIVTPPKVVATIALPAQPMQPTPQVKKKRRR
jgi:zinc D-Ala-D-Ala carboxypeptidase